MNKILDLRTTEEILREQIRDLNALLDMKNKRIIELEALQTIPQKITLVGSAGPHNGLPPYAPHVITDFDRKVSTECNIPDMAYQCANCTCGDKNG